MRIGRLEINWNGKRDLKDKAVWFRSPSRPVRLGDLTPSQLRSELLRIKNEIQLNREFSISNITQEIYTRSK